MNLQLLQILQQAIVSIFEKIESSLSKDFEKFTDQINTFYQSKKKME